MTRKSRRSTANSCRIGAGESFSVGVVAAQFCILKFDGIDRANPPRVVIELVHERARRDFVRRGEIRANEIERTNQFYRFAQLIRRNLKAPVLHVDLACLQRCVLHLWRQRMRHRITQHAEADWGTFFSNS